MILRFLNLQGMIGIAASLLLLGLFVVKAGEARHWHKQSGRFEQLYLGEQSARPDRRQLPRRRRNRAGSGPGQRRPRRRGPTHYL